MRKARTSAALSITANAVAFPCAAGARTRSSGYDQAKYKAMYDQAVQAINGNALGKNWKSSAEEAGIKLDSADANAVTFVMRHKFLSN